MLNNYQIIDADCHVMEPSDLWEKYLEPEFKNRAPYLENSREENGTIQIDILSDALKQMRVEGEKIYHRISDENWNDGIKQMIKFYARYGIRRYDPESQVKAIKILGADIAFHYPTMGVWLFAIDTMEPQLAGAYIRAYNNWLRDFCSYEPHILRGVGAINRHDPDEMVTELQRIAEFGWKAVVVRPNPIKGRLLSDPAHEPFWNECERLGIAVGIHESSHARVPTAGSDRFHTRFGIHACSHPLEQMMAFLALLEGGVLERHPKLRVAFLESGCGWLPYWLWRLDREYHDLSWEVTDNVQMKPSDYFRRQCFIAMEPSEPYLSNVINYIGTDNLILGSDFPHIDHDPYIIKETIALENQLSPKTIQKILWDNPRRFYGLN